MENPEIEKPPVENRPSFVSKIIGNKRLLLAVAVLIVATVAGIAVFIHQNSKINKAKKSKTNQQVEQIPVAPTPEAPKDDYGKAILAADQFYLKQDYDGAIKAINAGLPKITDKAQLFNLYARMGRCYKAKGDSSSAINSFEQAQQTGYPAADALYVDIAEMAEKAGDKPKAIAAYKKAIEILNKTNSPAAKKIAQDYQDKIKSLGGS